MVAALVVVALMLARLFGHESTTPARTPARTLPVDVDDLPFREMGLIAPSPSKSEPGADEPLACVWPDVEGDLTISVGMPPMLPDPMVDGGEVDWAADRALTPWTLRYTLERDGDGRHILPRGTVPPSALRQATTDGASFAPDALHLFDGGPMRGVSLPVFAEDAVGSYLEVVPDPEGGCPMVRRVPSEARALLVLVASDDEPIVVQGCGLSETVAGDRVRREILPGPCTLRRYLARRWSDADGMARQAAPLDVDLEPGGYAEVDVSVEPGTWAVSIVHGRRGFVVAGATYSDCEPFRGVQRGALVGSVVLSFDGIDLTTPGLDVGVDIPGLVLPEPGRTARFRLRVPGLAEPVSVVGTACGTPRPERVPPRAPEDRGWDAWVIRQCRDATFVETVSPRAYGAAYGVDLDRATRALDRMADALPDLVALGIDCDQVKRDMAPWGAQVDWGLPTE